MNEREGDTRTAREREKQKRERETERERERDSVCLPLCSRYLLRPVLRTLIFSFQTLTYKFLPIFDQATRASKKCTRYFQLYKI